MPSAVRFDSTRLDSSGGGHRGKAWVVGGGGGGGGSLEGETRGPAHAAALCPDGKDEVEHGGDGTGCVWDLCVGYFLG